MWALPVSHVYMFTVSVCLELWGLYPHPWCSQSTWSSGGTWKPHTCLALNPPPIQEVVSGFASADTKGTFLHCVIALQISEASRQDSLVCSPACLPFLLLSLLTFPPFLLPHFCLKNFRSCLLAVWVLSVSFIRSFFVLLFVKAVFAGYRVFALLIFSHSASKLGHFLLES